jgi:hypothetical protein
VIAAAIAVWPVPFGCTPSDEKPPFQFPAFVADSHSTAVSATASIHAGRVPRSRALKASRSASPVTGVWLTSVAHESDEVVRGGIVQTTTRLPSAFRSVASVWRSAHIWALVRPDDRSFVP